VANIRHENYYKLNRQPVSRGVLYVSFITLSLGKAWRESLPKNASASGLNNNLKVSSRKYEKLSSFKS
jgi:hypothetical protein